MAAAALKSGGVVTKVRGVWALVWWRGRRTRGSARSEQKVHIGALRRAVAGRIEVWVVVADGGLTLRSGVPLRQIENV